MSDYQVPIRQSPEIFRRKLNAIFDLIVGRLDAMEGRVRSGTGTPEGVVTAPVGALFLRSDGGANTTLYVKESGSGNTGWAAK